MREGGARIAPRILPVSEIGKGKNVPWDSGLWAVGNAAGFPEVEVVG
jgi:hypothetical protein